MPRKQEARLAHNLGAALRAELSCDVRVERGLQWRVRATVGNRSANVLCFWYDSAGTTSLNDCYGWVEPGVPRTAGGEYLPIFLEQGERIAGGRTQALADVISSLHAWLLERRSLTDLYIWSFVDARLRALHRLAADLASIPVRVVLENVLGVELWVYGDDRACSIDPVTGCTFLIGPSVVAGATVPEAFLADVVAAWICSRVSLAELANCTSNLDVLPHAHLLERGDTTAWHWADVLYWARAGHEHTDLLLLLERLRPEIRRFYSFTSIDQLIFAYNSRGSYTREGLPSVVPAGPGRFTIMLGRDHWTDDATATEQRLADILGRAPGTPFDGSQADLDVMAIDQELALQGSPLRAYIHQRRRTFSARVVAGPRVCQITTDRGWCIHFHDHTGERGWQYYDDATSAIAALRCWIERGEDVELHAIG